MKKNTHRFPVEMMSKALGVSRSGYYKWLKIIIIGSIHAELDEEIRKEFENSKGTYGSPRICSKLSPTVMEKGVSRSTVARRMKAMKLVARPRRKYVVTTDSKHDFRISDNLLDRKFNCEEVNKVWVGDITYIRTDKGWRYLTTVIDLADRSVVGWALSDTMHAQHTSVEALKKALKSRYIGKISGLMFHSDRGIQYACDEFRYLLEEYQIVQSMSGKGNCWDNAVAESFFKTIKTEELDQYATINAERLYSLVFRYIEGWYNTLRIHSALKWKTPSEIFNEKRLKQAA